MRAARNVVLALWTASAYAAPGPAPQQRTELAQQRCAECHEKIAEEWGDSFHRQSYTDPAVQRSLPGERQPFCRACHAPEADPSLPASGWAAAVGVACVTCHLGGSAAAPKPVGQDVTAHLGLRLPRPGTAACARCHEFQFPDGNVRSVAEWMQRTIAEHAQSEHRDRTCIDCHMPRTGADGHRSHRFAAGHDDQTLRRALVVKALRLPAELRLRLSPQGVGHALPTGDLFRQLVITAQALSPSAPPRALATLVLARSFKLVRQVSGHYAKVESADNRLLTQREVPLRLTSDTRAQAIRWQVRYQRVLSPRQGPLGGPLLDGEVVLAEGVVPPL